MNYEEFVETIEKDAEQMLNLACVMQMNMTMQWKQLPQITSKVQ